MWQANDFTLATIVRLETSKKSFDLEINHILPDWRLTTGMAPICDWMIKKSKS